MKVKNINLGKYIGQKVVITKVTNKKDNTLIGKTGDLTNPFSCFKKGTIGIFLDDNKGLNTDICNLLDNDEVDIIDETIHIFSCEKCGKQVRIQSVYDLLIKLCSECWEKENKKMNKERKKK